MLWAERSKLHGAVARMGQDNSKAKGTEAQPDVDLFTTPPEQANTPLANGHQSSTSLSPSQQSKDQGDSTAHGEPPGDARVARKPLKRPTDEREQDEYGRDRRHRSRTPQYTEQNGRTDHYSSRVASRPVSPSNTRHSFIPDRGDYWSPNFGRRRGLSGGSQVSPPRHGRADKWSPPLPHSSPPRRPSPIRRGHSNSSDLPWSQPNSSPPAHRRGDSDSHDQLEFQNRGWKASGPASRRQSDNHVSNPRTFTQADSQRSPERPATHRPSGDTFPERVSFRGLEGVPTGPKGSNMPPPLSGRADRTLPSDVGEGIKRLPHIFISTNWLPAKKATVKHLHRFLGKYVPEESDVAVDQTGYYIVFEDSVEGRARLDKCYNTRSGGKLFSEYSLVMERRDSRPDSDANTNMSGVGDYVDMSTSIGGLPAEAAANAQAYLDRLDLPHVENSAHEIPKATDPHLQRHETDVGAESKTESPADIAIPPLCHSSPLRVPLRHDKDDSSSSISGFTGSDMSASKHTTCHSCKTAPMSDVDPLVHCSSCPRRYHRRCHARPPISTTLNAEDIWQCRRCIKKQVQPKSRLSNASLPTSSSPAPSVGQPEDRPTKRLRLDSPEHTPRAITAQYGAIQTVADTTKSPENGYHTHPLQAELRQNPFDTLARDDHMAENQVVHSDDVHFHEADDLVEKSFTLLEQQVEVAKPIRHGKLNIVRKKVIQPSPSPNVEDLESRSETVPQSASLQSRAEHINQMPFQDDEPAVSKRKSHKWAGGGADKHIIQAGIESLFSTDQTLRDDRNSAQSTASEVRLSNGSAMVGRETPESGQVSRPNGRTEPAKDDLNSVEESDADKNKVKPRSSVTPSNESEQRPDSVCQAGSSQRMKSSGIANDKCGRCKKPIAFNPSGTNKLCSRCKRDVSADTLLTTTEKFANAGADKKESFAMPEESGDRNKGGGKLVKPTGLHKASEDPSPLAHKPEELEHLSGSQAHQTKPRKTCKACKIHRRRCNHQLPTSVKKPPQEFSPMNTPGAKTVPMRDDDVPKDDLDFWNTESNPKVVEFISNDKPSPDVQPPFKVQTRRSSPLSPPPGEEDLAETPVKSQPGARKRKSNTTVAKNDLDIGNSYERPPNTYMKLIGMALCAAPDHSLKTQEIIQWIDTNIPSYTIGEGTNWENGISATLSMRQEKENGVHGLWRKIEGDGAKKNAACRYELLPGNAETMLHWDPVLQQPVSPLKVKQARPKEDSNHKLALERDEPPDFLTEGKHDDRDNANDSPDHISSPVTARRKAREAKHSRQRRKLVISDPMDAEIDDTGGVVTPPEQMVEGREISDQGNDESSDDEPLVSARRRSFQAPRTAADYPAMEAEADDIDRMMDIDGINGINGVNGVSESPTPTTTPHGVKTSYAGPRLISLEVVEQHTLAQLIKKDAENMDYSAKSLFDEWPEYDPDNEFDREAKIEEIKRRPTRKQRFGKASRDPWLEWKPARLAKVDVSRGSSFSVERPSRATRNAMVDAYPWENGEGTVQHCDTLEELFGLPNNPIAIIHEGQLAYRDGTRNDDGTLPRAKHIYKTGYA